MWWFGHIVLLFYKMVQINDSRCVKSFIWYNEEQLKTVNYTEQQFDYYYGIL